MRPRSAVSLSLFCVAVVLLTAPSPASSQTLVDERLWIGWSVQERSGTDSPWRWAIESQLRTRNGVDDLDVVTIRPFVGFDLSRRSSIWLGYTAAATFLPTAGVRQEHRVVEQYTWAGPALGGNLQSRFRLEERFIEGDTATGWRAREAVRYSHPFVSGGRTSWVVWNELLVHLRTTTLTRSGLDQNRAFAGVSQSVGTSLRIEAGYLNQSIRSLSPPSRMNHILSVGLTLTL